MKRTFPLILPSIVFVFTCAVFGQDGWATAAVIPAVVFDIAEQSQSPIHVSVENRPVAGVIGRLIRVTNTGNAAVSAFVLHVKATPTSEIWLTFLAHGLAAAASRTQALNVPSVSDGAERPLASVDYVLFEDGRSWGDDALGKSKDVKAFLTGRGLALSRLKELLVGQDDTDVMKSLGAFRSSVHGEPVSPVGRSPRTIDWAARGYEEILNILRRMSKNAEAGKELARKLEVMQGQ